MMDTVVYILSSVASIALPFGFTFGSFVVFLWSVPLIMRFFKSIF